MVINKFLNWTSSKSDLVNHIFSLTFCQTTDHWVSSCTILLKLHLLDSQQNED